jgi:hypothetical protein
MLDINKMTYIGSFGVDSGQAMVGDPCYLEDWKPWNSEENHFDEHKQLAGQYGYLGACGVTLDKGYGELGNSAAVAFTTGYGDGIYPVYAEINDDGRVARIVIDFVGEDEE